MTRLPNIRPGEIPREEFLNPMGINQYRLARAIGVPAMRINEIRAGSARRFSRALAPRRWLRETGTGQPAKDGSVNYHTLRAPK